MKRESGSALWFILLAIALLAALAIVITRASNETSQNGNIEHQRIVESQLMRYAAGIATSVDQMRLRGISENLIDFDTSALTGYANAACTTNDCQVFATGGGGETYNLPADVNDGSAWVFTGNDAVTGSNADLIMIMPNITEKLCQQIDTNTGIGAIPKPSGAVDIATKFTGAFSTTPKTIDGVANKKTGCFQGNTDGSGQDISANYYFYEVLLTRN